jgi:hypothetical protein
MIAAAAITGLLVSDSFLLSSGVIIVLMFTKVLLVGEGPWLELSESTPSPEVSPIGTGIVEENTAAERDAGIGAVIMN